MSLIQTHLRDQYEAGLAELLASDDALSVAWARFFQADPSKADIRQLIRITEDWILDGIRTGSLSTRAGGQALDLLAASARELEDGEP